MNKIRKLSLIGLLLVSFIFTSNLLPVNASSHREAPGTAKLPKLDGTDLYMFRSYEEGREDFVTFIFNYNPFQESIGGPNYFTMDEDAVYELHIDNNGDAIEDLTFQFRFNNENRTQATTLQVGDAGNTKPIQAAVLALAPLNTNLGTAAQPALAQRETYTVDLIRGPRRGVRRRVGRGRRRRIVRRIDRDPITDASNGSDTFVKPLDNIGTKTIPDYASYANAHVYNINIPGSELSGRMFVGQRQENFSVNVGKVFDLVNLNPVANSQSGTNNTIRNLNITSFALELPISFLTENPDSSTIGAWFTSSLQQDRRQRSEREIDNVVSRLLSTATGGVIDLTSSERHSGALRQVSRLANPLVNELVIGLQDKDKFNASEPRNDGQFADYVTNPTFPEIIEVLFPSVPAPNLFPRTDLVQVFLTGVPGLNELDTVGGSEMMRLNTATPVTPLGSQNALGVIGGDNAGYPNGRRPGDDVVDITLRVAQGALIADNAVAPSNNVPLTDEASVPASQAAFPYLNNPVAGDQPTEPTQF